MSARLTHILVQLNQLSQMGVVPNAAPTKMWEGMQLQMVESGICA